MKKESFKKELREIGSCFKARRLLREEERRAAGVVLAHEYHEAKNQGISIEEMVFRGSDGVDVQARIERRSK